MTKKNNNNLIIWGIIIVLIFLIAPKLPMFYGKGFSIIQTTVCDESVISNWELSINAQDSKGTNNGISNNVNFYSTSANFNGTNSINFPILAQDNIIMQVKDNSVGDADYSFLAKVNGENYINGIHDNTKQIIPISSTFGIGRNMSVKNIILFSNLTVSQMLNYYNNGSIRNVCYQTTEYQNVTCKEYLDSTITTKQPNTCLAFSGDFFPTCNFHFENTTTFKIENNLCKENFYCQSSCLVSDGCYSTNQLCIENLKYSCYVLQNNACSEKTDYSSCISNANATYSSLSGCNANVVQTQSVVAPSSTPPTLIEEPLADKEVFQIFGFKVTVLYLIFALLIIIGLLYFLGVFERK